MTSTKFVMFEKVCISQTRDKVYKAEHILQSFNGLGLTATNNKIRYHRREKPVGDEGYHRREKSLDGEGSLTGVAAVALERAAVVVAAVIAVMVEP